MPLLSGHNVDAESEGTIAEVGFGLRRTGSLAETVSRRYAGAALQPTTANTVFSAIYLPIGTVVTNLTFCSGSTALGTGTHQLAGLYNSARTSILATSADGTSGAWAANVEKAFAMTTPFTVSTAGLYYVALAVAATTVPTVVGVAQATAAVAALAPVIAFTDSGNTITTALVASPTVSAGFGTVWCSVS